MSNFFSLDCNTTINVAFQEEKKLAMGDEMFVIQNVCGGHRNESQKITNAFYWDLTDNSRNPKGLWRNSHYLLKESMTALSMEEGDLLIVKFYIKIIITSFLKFLRYIICH